LQKERLGREGTRGGRSAALQPSKSRPLNKSQAGTRKGWARAVGERSRVGQNHIYTTYMTICMVIPCQKYRIYTVYTYKCMVLANLRKEALRRRTIFIRAAI
jgi:hypothetical protein